MEQGETIWRISKAYNIPIDFIVESNKIPDVALIEQNQLIFIPGAESNIDIPVEDALRKNEFSWPIKGKVVFYFNQREESHLSKGIGIRALEGATVRAAREGRVVFADYLTGYEHTVIIDHADGYHSVYSQNSKVLVDVGQYVLKDVPIAQVGRNGRLAFLHFEIRKNSRPDNPLYYKAEVQKFEKELAALHHPKVVERRVWKLSESRSSEV